MKNFVSFILASKMHRFLPKEMMTIAVLCINAKISITTHEERS
jgi:hypothetical protein